MTSKNILLVCGAGASSGFMASSIRKAAKKAGKDYTVNAASESQLDDLIDDIDVLLIGAHMAFKAVELSKKADAKNVKVAIIPKTIYVSLDGAGALKVIESLEN